ncbi:CPBP family intramembrane glutamic endopeptidase [Calidithermus timidus]|uniref:CPBP family intramembrane glutamic endopeptidase n=1 Tax=Calidithermus timidus TaxID=307124 RepID=UPI00039B40E3|nr:CPBP family intramembrane glutamic endopeptidase [Calidithermus timidus]
METVALKRPFWPAWLYFAGLVLAEWLAAGANRGPGMLVHTLIVLSALIHAAYLSGPAARMLSVLALAPMVRVLDLMMPQSFVEAIWRFPLVNFPLIIAVFITIRTLNLRRQEVGLQVGFLPVQLLIALSGLVVGIIEHRIIQPQALVGSLEWPEILLPIVILMVFTGFSEELMFRGLLQHMIIPVLGPLGGISFVALIFGAFHFGWQSAGDVLFVTIVAWVWGWLAWRTRSILGVSLAHGLANVWLFVIMPLASSQ